jgi:dienelactone hydrolase
MMKRRAALATLLSLGLLMGCASRNGPNPGDAPPASGWTSGLAAAVGMPDEDAFDVRLLDWRDGERDRPVPAKLYLPKQAKSVPLVVLSHGIGGSREGYSYIGKFLAANGIAALHLQHAGSDRALWFGNPITMVFRLQGAAQANEAIARARDVRFALDQVFAESTLKSVVDRERIGMIGHSYGANTTLLVSGARVEQDEQPIDLRDARVRTSVIISAPPFYGLGDHARILGDVNIPTLHITATADVITIPGYKSGLEDRLSVYDAIASKTQAKKMLAVFKEGSHSMFTDRLYTGGNEHNPKVKRATRELVLEFLRGQFAEPAKHKSGLGEWLAKHTDIIANSKLH